MAPLGDFLMMRDPLESGDLLERAIEIALEAHRNQRDKAGRPYILHVLRVMMAMKTDIERITAALHDVIEDSEWTFDRLRGEGFPEQVLGALELLTKRKGEDYEAFIERVAPNPLARRVKIADLRDNLDISRLAELGASDVERLQKYLRSLRRIEAE